MSTHHIAFETRTLKVTLTPNAPPTIDGAPIQAELRELQPGVLSILLTHPDGTTQSFACLQDDRPEGPAVLIENRRLPYTLADPRSLRTTTAAQSDTGPRPLKAPMPGRIVRVLVAEGDTVDQGQGCVVIEAMKMQNELKAPRAGTIRRLTATIGETVPANAILLIIE